MQGHSPDIRGHLSPQAAKAGRSPAHPSAADAPFPLQERGGAHMHIGGVSIFEGASPADDEMREHTLLGEYDRMHDLSTFALLGLTG